MSHRKRVHAQQNGSRLYLTRKPGKFHRKAWRVLQQQPASGRM